SYSQALKKITAHEYDCLVLNPALTDRQELSRLGQLRVARKYRYVIVISTMQSAEQPGIGEEWEADGVLLLPFQLTELKKCLRSLDRNRESAESGPTLKWGNVELDTGQLEVWVDRTPVALNRKEFEILHYLLGRPQLLVSKQMLAAAVWGEASDPAGKFDFVYAQIKNLRKKMREAGADIQIKTVYGYGYKLVKRSFTEDRISGVPEEP
ncbi:MAG: response regulator transcription factor, partial [Rikenellaceae bacterium]|nr:response regulator transcription factor [Rikenellaceae bacterium]